MPEWEQEISKRLSRASPPLARATEIVEELAQPVEDRYQDLLASGRTSGLAHHPEIDGKVAVRSRWNSARLCPSKRYFFSKWFPK